MKNDKKSSRRDFFKIAGAAGVVGKALTSADIASADTLPAPKANLKKWVGGKFPKAPVMAKGRGIGSNDRIMVGHIGIGGQGGTHLNNFKKNAKTLNTQSIALCDVYSVRLEKKKAFLLEGDPEGTTVQAEKDYRKLLDNK